MKLEVEVMGLENKEKLKQFIHYLIYLTQNREEVGKTVLYKMMYFSEFDFYELYEEMLTGELYRKIPMGPAPVHFDEALEELEREEKIRYFKNKYGRYEQFRFESLREPDTSLLNRSERNVIEADVEKLSGMNATEMTQYSHADMPCKASKDGEIIDYELVFYRHPPYSVREYEDD